MNRTLTPHQTTPATADQPDVGVAARAVTATKLYGKGDAEVRALDGVTVDFATSRFTAIMGPSGSGKSTLMHALAGLDSLTSGSVWIGAVELGQLKEKKLTELRRDSVGFIFQAFNRWPRIWERAVELALGPAPALPAVLVQRDFHPGNVLWRRRQVSGVVDWQAASVGPAVVDVAHCRFNLLAFDRSVADRFTAIWSQESGADFHPWADVVTIVGCLDDLRSGLGSERHLIEELLADAVARLDMGP